MHRFEVRTAYLDPVRVLMVYWGEWIYRQSLFSAWVVSSLRYERFVPLNQAAFPSQYTRRTTWYQCPMPAVALSRVWPALNGSAARVLAILSHRDQSWNE